MKYTENKDNNKIDNSANPEFFSVNDSLNDNDLEMETLKDLGIENDGLTEDDLVNDSAKKRKKVKTELERKKIKKQHNLWWLKISIISFCLAAFFNFLTDLASNLNNIVIMSILLILLIAGSIIFDGIGVAVTSCELKPLASMSSKKVYGAKTAINLIKNAEKVANICNDVVGDIFGIISGGCTVVIVANINTMIFGSQLQMLISIALSSLVAAVTIGGKAALKEVAIKKSKNFVMFVARFLAIFSKEERKISKQRKQRNLKEKENKNEKRE